MSSSVAGTLDSESTAIGYLYTAFAMMIFYDHALCLEHEIDLFWRARFVWPTWIFLANRYVLLLYGIGCILQVPLWTTPMGCEATILIFYIANMLLFAISAIFAALRVYAISGKNLTIALGVLLIGVVPSGLNLYTTVDQSYAYVGAGGLCARTRYYSLQTENILDIAICACAVLADLVVIIVTWRRTYRSWQTALRLGESRPVMNLLLRDGSLYFAMMLILNVLELVVMRALVTGSSASVAYTSYILVPLSPIFVNHFLIGLRQLSHVEPHSSLSTSDSTRPISDDSSLATMGGHIKVDFYLSGSSVTGKHHLPGDWDNTERDSESAAEDVEMNII